MTRQQMNDYIEYVNSKIEMNVLPLTYPQWEIMKSEIITLKLPAS